MKLRKRYIGRLRDIFESKGHPTDAEQTFTESSTTHLVLRRYVQNLLLQSTITRYVISVENYKNARFFRHPLYVL